MAGQDTTEIVVGANGDLYLAAVGTTGPTDIATALNASFKKVGYLTADGVEASPGKDVSDVESWQSFFPTRKIVAGRTLDFAVTFQQWNELTIPVVLDGATITKTTGPPAYYTITPPSPETIYERAMVVVWQDGAYTFRWHVPRVMIGDQGSIPIRRTEEAAMPVTFSVLATSGVNPWTLISDLPGLDAAS